MYKAMGSISITTKKKNKNKQKALFVWGHKCWLLVVLLWQNSEQNQPKEGRAHVDSWFEGTVSTLCEEGMMTGIVGNWSH